jgi:hypothetical protein
VTSRFQRLPWRDVERGSPDEAPMRAACALLEARR